MVLNEDVDYYAVEAKKGQRLSVEVEGLRLGESFFDPSVAIMDTNRFVLAAADDTPLLAAGLRLFGDRPPRRRPT